MSNKAIEVYVEALKRNEKEGHNAVTQKPARNDTRLIQGSRGISRGPSRDLSRDNSSDKSRDLPSRDEIQEFTFRLRDEIKVKVQTEVPHQWQYASCILA